MSMSQEDALRMLSISGGSSRSLVDRLAAAEAELTEVAGQAKAAYRKYAELDRQQTAKANEVRDLRLQIREAAADTPEGDR